MDFYFTIDSQGFAEYKDRGSKFLAYAYPIKNADEFKKYLQILKKEHPKAVHYCFAYKTGSDGNNFRVSDDGEPSGTAGKQILAQINSKNVTDILVIVVRYFGGTLLGVPGLINAYKTATVLALQCTHSSKKAIEINYSLQFNYTEINEVMRVLRQFNCTIYKNEALLFCNLEVGIPRFRLQEALHLLKNILHVEIQQEIKS